MGELRSVPSFSLNGIIRCDGLCFCATYETPKGRLAVHVLGFVADELMGTKRGHGQALLINATNTHNDCLVRVVLWIYGFKPLALITSGLIADNNASW